MARKSYDELQFRDDFLFCKILESRPDLTKELLELILGIGIKEVKVQKQLPIEIINKARGIRLDVYAEDDNNTVYDIEMQTTSRKDLPKRSRYYQGMIDLQLIKRNDKFSKLKKSYVIFICMNDPFKADRSIYTFENICIEDTSIKLGDESTKVFLNASSKSNEISADLKDFFTLLKTGGGSTHLTQEIECEVAKARAHEKWRTEYMTLYMRDLENQDIGREEAQVSAIKNLMSKLGYSMDEAMDLLEIPIEDRDDLKEQIMQINAF